MAENTVSFPDLALDKFSGNDPDQDAKSILLTVENKINLSLGSRPTDIAERARYLYRKKALFSSLLRGPAAEWYANSINDAATWDQIRTAFIDRFSDDRDRYRHRITAENCVRGNKELIKNFYHRVKSAVDKGWPLVPNGNQNERDNQHNQRNAKYIEFTVRGLKPTGLKRKAHEYLIEHPNATWDAFQTHITSKDVIYTISSELVPNTTADQNTKLHSLEQQIKKLTALFEEQQVNQVTQPNPRPANPDNKSRQNMTRFRSYYRRNDTLSCTAELKPTMIRLKDKHATIRSAKQSSLMITINEEDRNLGLRIIRTSISNPDTEIRTTRHPTDRLASTQIGTEIPTQIDSTSKPDQVTPGTTDQITVNKLSITSMPEKRILILSTTETSHRATTYLHPTQFSSSMTRDKM